VESFPAAGARRAIWGKRCQRALHRDPKLKTDVLSSAILDFGVARAVFTVSTQAHPGQRVDVLGTGGQISLPLPFNAYPDVPLQISVTTGVGARTIHLPIADQYVGMFEAFCRGVREGGGVPTLPMDAIDNMKVQDALFRSEKSGGWEKVR
jgi:predicted dehydrogenase